MKISPLSLNLNNYIRNNKPQNQPRLKPMVGDSISFSAKIPADLQAELNYQKLLDEDGKGRLTYLAESTDPEVLKLLKQMQEDGDISAEFKIEFLTRNDCQAFKKRLELGKENSDYHSQVAIAMLNLMPEEERHRILSCDGLINASVGMTKVLLSSDQMQQLYGNEAPGHRPKNKEPFYLANTEKRRAILECCDEELQRKLLLDPHIVHSRSFHQTLELVQNEQIRKDMFQVLHWEGGHNILHKVDPEKLDHYLNVCNLKKYPDVLANLLLQENNEGYIPIETVKPDAAQILLDAVPDKETLNKMYTTRKSNGGKTVANRCKTEAVITIITGAPSDKIRKMLLTTKAKDQGSLPLARLDLEGKKKLIELSPDTKTKKIQLTTRDENNKLPIDVNDAVWFLTQSPDDETLMLQLDERRTWERQEGCYAKKVTGPIRSRLSFDDYFKVFDMMKDVSSIKETLLSEWQENKKASYQDENYTNSTADVITKDIVHGMDLISSQRYPLQGNRDAIISRAQEQQEKLFNLLIEVIGDDSTTTGEAIELIERYMKYMPKAQEKYLSRLAQYFKSQVQ